MEKIKEYYRRKLPHIILPGSIFFITSRLSGSLPREIIIELKQKKEKDTESLMNIPAGEKRIEKYLEYQNEYFELFDNALIKYSNGPYWLKEENAAGIVKEALLYRDKKVYDIFAFTIMSNHIHLIIRPYTDKTIKQDDNLPVDQLEKLVTSSPVDQLDKLITPPSVGQLGKLITSSSDKLITPGRKIPSPYILGDIMESLKRYTGTKCNKQLSRKGTFWQHENYDHIIRNYDELIEKIKYTLNNPVKAGLTDDYKNWKWNYFNPELL